MTSTAADPATASHPTPTPPPMPDQEDLDAFLGRFVADLGATTAAAGVVIGHRLGLYRSLGEGPATTEELAARTGTHARPVAEWLHAQAAGGYVSHDPDTDRFRLDAAQAFCLTDPDGPVYLPGAFQLALGALRAEPRITESFRTGTGMGWHEHDEDVFLGCEAFFRPGYVANLTTSWIPALEGVEDRLRAGGRVADVGCGLGASTVIMAQAYPATTLQGSDYHDGSVARARERAAAAGVDDRASFEVASAQTFTGTGYDLVTTFDCLHDMGDPVGAARHVREALTPDGCWLLVEPAAGETPAQNYHPRGRRSTTGSRHCCASPTRWPRAGNGRSAPRPESTPSARSSSRPGSPASAAPPRPRSTTSTKPVPEADVVPTTTKGPTMVDILSRLDEVKQKTASALSAADRDAGASAVLVAVVREFDTKATKATSAADGTARDAVIELEQAADSARAAAAADTGLTDATRQVVEDAHLAICILKTEV